MGGWENAKVWDQDMRNEWVSVSFIRRRHRPGCLHDGADVAAAAQKMSSFLVLLLRRKKKVGAKDEEKVDDADQVEVHFLHMKWK